MIAQTLDRVQDRELFAAPLVVGAMRHEKFLLQALVDTRGQGGTVILEPCSRNTAPAIALGAIEAGDDAILLVMPSDHVIEDVSAFQEAIDRALPAARRDRLVTFGVEPSKAETGFGYIEQGDALTGVPNVFEVLRFVEKPNSSRAQEMVLDGGYCWNSGMFLFRAGVVIDQLKRLQPDMYAAVHASMSAATRRDAIVVPKASEFAQAPANSIDYAVMELAQNIAIVPMSCGWSDVGSWDALAAISPKDEHGNVIVGDVGAFDCSGILSRAEDVRIQAIGVSDMIIVSSGKDVLIVPRGQSQRVKELREIAKTDES